MYTPAEANALASFRFFDDEDPRAKSHSTPCDTLPTDLDGSAYIQNLENSITIGGTIVVQSALSPFPATEESTFIGLNHPSGSPVLRRNLILDDHHPVNISETSCTHLHRETCDGFDNTAHQLLDDDEDVQIHAKDDHSAQNEGLPIPKVSVIFPEEDSTIAVAKQVERPSRAVSEERGSLRPEIVEINQNHAERRHSLNDRERPLQGYESSLGSKSSENFPPTTQELIEDAFVSEIKSLVDISVSVWSEKQSYPLAHSQSKLDSPYCDEMTLGDSQSSRPQWPSSLLSEKTSLNDIGTCEQTESVDSGNSPSITRDRPASPPLHRFETVTRMRLEPQDRGHWTLYDLSCWSDRVHLKSLLKGPVFEFRTEPDALPFLQNVSEEMLKHFCGEDQVARLIIDFSLPSNQEEYEDEEASILVFPESLVDPTAIMRIVRYMRRCCARTTTVTKPHFQLHAPPSLEANIETIRACNIFGLYADARRLQNFLTTKRIPGGNLTMEDVEIIWEGYDGGLRDSVYTDALLTHIVYNVLGSDNVDREDLLMLLEQEEFSELRKMIGYELGVKKRKAEEKEAFMMRKQMERADRNDEAKRGKQLTKREAFLASRGPTVQGRLLRVLSQDALMVADSTLQKRYKTRPSLRRPVSTPDLCKEQERLESVGYLYQNALKGIKEHVFLTKFKVSEYGVREAEETQTVSLEMVEGQITRPSAPTPTGRKSELDNTKHQLDCHLSNNDSLPLSESTVEQGTSKPYYTDNQIIDHIRAGRIHVQRLHEIGARPLRDGSQSSTTKLHPRRQAQKRRSVSEFETSKTFGHTGANRSLATEPSHQLQMETPRNSMSRTVSDLWRSELLQTMSKMPHKLKQRWEELREVVWKQ